MNPVLVACSHGTSDPAGQETIRRLIAALRSAAPAFDVRAAVVDVEDHRLGVVLDDIARPAVVVPLLLSAGFHVHHDIADAVNARPDVVAASPLGPDAALTQIAVQRLAEVGATPDDLVVVGASASSQAQALSDIDQAARDLRDAWGGPVRVGHVGHAGEPLSDVVQHARTSGRRVVVSSYLLAPGYFQTQLERSGADLVTGPLLTASPDRLLVNLVLRRFEAAARNVSWSPPPRHAISR